MTNNHIELKPKNYKSDIKPVWCPGCGHFGVLAALTKALAYLKIPPNETALISGIGCSSRLPAYLDTYGFHGIHGRALAVGTGIKAIRPELNVIVAGGDGDGYSIGGNHFLHACRRNMDMLYIVMDNEVYGMTKGQASPTTAPNWEKSKLTPHGTGTRPFNPAAIALAAGASFIARGFTGKPNAVTELIVRGIEHKGFACLQILSPCTTFRPEQKEWKKIVRPQKFEVTDNPIVAAQNIHADDGFSSGIIFKANYPVWQPELDIKCEVESFADSFKIPREQ